MNLTCTRFVLDSFFKCFLGIVVFWGVQNSWCASLEFRTEDDLQNYWDLSTPHSANRLLIPSEINELKIFFPLTQETEIVFDQQGKAGAAGKAGLVGANGLGLPFYTPQAPSGSAGSRGSNGGDAAAAGEIKIWLTYPLTQHLRLIARGGRGGDGGRGGSGGDGANGFSWPHLEWWARGLARWLGQSLRGGHGGDGGNGGDGGLGGNGGDGAHIKVWVSGHDSLSWLSADVSAGEAGKGADAGLGGAPGAGGEGSIAGHKRGHWGSWGAAGLSGAQGRSGNPGNLKVHFIEDDFWLDCLDLAQQESLGFSEPQKRQVFIDFVAEYCLQPQNLAAIFRSQAQPQPNSRAWFKQVHSTLFVQMNEGEPRAELVLNSKELSAHKYVFLAEPAGRQETSSSNFWVDLTLKLGQSALQPLVDDRVLELSPSPSTGLGCSQNGAAGLVGNRGSEAASAQLFLVSGNYQIKIEGAGGNGQNGRSGFRGQKGCRGVNGLNGRFNKGPTPGWPGFAGGVGGIGGAGGSGGNGAQVDVNASAYVHLLFPKVALDGGHGGLPGWGGLGGEGGEGGRGGLKHPSIFWQKNAANGPQGFTGSSGSLGVAGAEGTNGKVDLQVFNSGNWVQCLSYVASIDEISGYVLTLAEKARLGLSCEPVQKEAGKNIPLQVPLLTSRILNLFDSSDVSMSGETNEERILSLMSKLLE